MTHGIDAVLVVFLCSGVALFAQDARPSSLRASIDREARLLAPQLSAKDASFKDSTNIKAPLVRAQRSDDWGAVRGLKQGTRVQVISRQGPAVTGRVIDVSETGISTDRGAFLRDEVVAVYQDHRFTTKQWVGIGALTGAATGLAIGVVANSRCRKNCELAGLGILFGPPLGALYGSFSGLFLGGIANRNPPRVIYRAPLTIESTASSVSTEPTAR